MMTLIASNDGHELECWMSVAEGEPKGGLVIVQEIFGVTDQLKGVANQYSRLGFDVAIPALFDRQKRNIVVPFDQGPKAREMMLACKLENTMADIEAAVKSLSTKHAHVAVMGFCWGGGLAIRAAQTLDIAGAVSFYGTRLPEYLDRPLKAPVIGHFGTTDAHVPEDMLAAAKAYLPDMEVHVYEAGHAFANDARADYVVAAAELAHERSREFLFKVMSA